MIFLLFSENIYGFITIFDFIRLHKKIPFPYWNVVWIVQNKLCLVYACFLQFKDVLITVKFKCLEVFNLFLVVTIFKVLVNNEGILGFK